MNLNSEFHIVPLLVITSCYTNILHGISGTSSYVFVPAEFQYFIITVVTQNSKYKFHEPAVLVLSTFYKEVA
jgi:hypothetical protein